MIKVCEICGKEYRPRNGTQKTCSKECGNKLAYNRVHKISKTVKCKVCGKEFVAHKGCITTCSAECRGKLISLSADNRKLKDAKKTRKKKIKYSFSDVFKIMRETGKTYGEVVYMMEGK